MKSLGITLKEERELQKMTLRQVEEATGISNAYLSQLENDKIKTPSANILHKLSVIYNIPLKNLLIAANIIQDEQPERRELFNSVSFSSKELTEEEEKELLEYLRFIRFKKDE
ncbi:XRE family transcriptional regulator [Dysgonomonas capnocytophagoides]|uniref:XRE family transcriptional regulator n=1 Tax=Dysgonomonas capnocytophagoides TaxID=45254 RepID=A0A4Y8L1I1_9BACT|nr:helix-turn-helix transcriptional regulator [Dysgonomonas capnocytophagoides]TFD96433.1 XRE family transcriptional regulator [Dysgonomonas capnocytophagoides]